MGDLLLDWRDNGLWMLVKKFPKAPLFFDSPEHDVPAVDDKVERGVDHHQQVVGRHHVGRPGNGYRVIMLSLVLASPRDPRLSLYCHRHIICVLSSRPLAPVVSR